MFSSRAAVCLSVTDTAPGISLGNHQMLPDKLGGILQLYSVPDFLAHQIPELCRLLKDTKPDSCFLQPVPFKNYTPVMY